MENEKAWAKEEKVKEKGKWKKKRRKWDERD